MAKKKKPRRPMPARIMPHGLADRLRDAHWFLEHGKLAKARELLEELDQKYPRQVEVLHPLSNVYYNQKDYRAYHSVCERLVELRPQQADFALMLAGACLTCLMPVLALRDFRRFLETWPNHPRAADARTTVHELEGRLDEILATLGLTGPGAFETAVLHEEIQAALNRGHFPAAERKAEELLRRQPNFTAAHNNLAEAYFQERKVTQAMTCSQRTLAIDPENVHALSNLSRYALLSGRLDEARDWAEKLKAAPFTGSEPWTKKAEALSYLGDDQGVLDMFAQFQEQHGDRTVILGAQFYHLVAVAACRLGRIDEARQYWTKSLHLQPGYPQAQENLADLSKPIELRDGPWPFSLNHWIPQSLITGLLAYLKPAGKDNEASRRLAREYFQHHPEFPALLPLLLDHGDPPARELAFHLIKLAQTPELLAALRDFMLGQRGPDRMRVEISQVVMEAGLLPSGRARMWVKGEWHDILLRGFEVVDGPTTARHHSPQVETMLEEGVAALRHGDPLVAEYLFRKALAIEPNSPDLLNNLSIAYVDQGREPEARALTQQIHERFPDYLFAIVRLARLALLDGKLPEARTLLNNLVARPRLNFAEFAALADAEIEYGLAINNKDAAAQWYEMWMRTDPDHPALQRHHKTFESSSTGPKPSSPDKPSGWLK